MSLFGALTNGLVTINGVNLSSRCKKFEIPQVTGLGDASGMGNTTKVNVPLLDEWTLTCDFIEDLAASGAGSVDATLSAIKAGRAAVTVAVRMDAGSISTTNPEWTGSAVLANLPLGGTHGTLAMKTGVAFHCAGPLSRNTA